MAIAAAVANAACVRTGDHIAAAENPDPAALAVFQSMMETLEHDCRVGGLRNAAKDISSDRCSQIPDPVSGTPPFAPPSPTRTTS